MVWQVRPINFLTTAAYSKTRCMDHHPIQSVRTMATTLSQSKEQWLFNDPTRKSKNMTMYIAIKLLSSIVHKRKCQHCCQMVELLEANQISHPCQPAPTAIKAKRLNDARSAILTLAGGLERQKPLLVVKAPQALSHPRFVSM